MPPSASASSNGMSHTLPLRSGATAGQQPSSTSSTSRNSGLFFLSLMFLAVPSFLLLLSNEHLLRGTRVHRSEDDVTRSMLTTSRDGGVALHDAILSGSSSSSSGGTGGEVVPTHLSPPPTRKYHIFQSSIGMSGSTLLVNILIGLFEGTDSKYAFLEQDYTNHHHHGTVVGQGVDADSKDYTAPINSTVVTKTHIIDVDAILTRYRYDFDRMFFVSSSRGEHHLDDRYCDPDGKYASIVLCLDYNDFIYNDPSHMLDSVRYVRRKVVERFPYFAGIKFDDDAAVDRIREMVQVMENMKNEPFGRTDDKFGVHGSHKGRFGRKFGAGEKKEKQPQVQVGRNVLQKEGGKVVINRVTTRGGGLVADRQLTTATGSLRRKEDPSERVRVAHILKKHRDVRKPSSWRNPKVTDSKEEATAALNVIVDKLKRIQREGDADKLRLAFQDVARVESDCASAKDGGDLGFFGRGRMHLPFEEASFALGVGEMSDIVDTKSGVHVILRLG